MMVHVQFLHVCNYYYMYFNLFPQVKESPEKPIKKQKTGPRQPLSEVKLPQSTTDVGMSMGMTPTPNMSVSQVV